MTTYQEKHCCFFCKRRKGCGNPCPDYNKGKKCGGKHLFRCVPCDIGFELDPEVKG
jgi:hypothetical protein